MHHDVAGECVEEVESPPIQRSMALLLAPLAGVLLDPGLPGEGQAGGPALPSLHVEIWFRQSCRLQVRIVEVICIT